MPNINVVFVVVVGFFCCTDFKILAMESASKEACAKRNCNIFDDLCCARELLRLSGRVSISVSHSTSLIGSRFEVPVMATIVKNWPIATSNINTKPIDARFAVPVMAKIVEEENPHFVLRRFNDFVSGKINGSKCSIVLNSVSILASYVLVDFHCGHSRMFLYWAQDDLVGVTRVPALMIPVYKNTCGRNVVLEAHKACSVVVYLDREICNKIVVRYLR